MPTSHHLNLVTWHTINMVYSAAAQRALKDMRYDALDTTGMDRLLKLIAARAGHWLAMQAEETKIALSAGERHALTLDRIERGLQCVLTRQLFDEAIEPLLARMRGCIAELLTRAGMGAEQIDTLYFTGGSSGIPALRAAVQGLLPSTRIVEGNLFGSIGSGLAIEAARRYG